MATQQTVDPLLVLTQLADITDAVEASRTAVAQARAHPALQHIQPQVVAEAALQAAHASAVLDGVQTTLEQARNGLALDLHVQGSLRVYSELGTLAATWSRAPAQVLARLHTLAAVGIANTSELGRPKSNDPTVTTGLQQVIKLVVSESKAPAIILAAVVHAELLRLAPFSSSNGIIARAAARITLINKGLDPDAILMVELGHLYREPEYIGTMNSYRTGTTDGVRAWLKHCCAALEIGATSIIKICE